MRLGRKELIISLILMIGFLVLVWSGIVLAADNTSSGQQTVNFWNTNANNNAKNIELVPANKDTGNNTVNNITNNTVKNTNTNTNTNANTTVPDTGLEDLPWAVIAICGVTAVFAYKKIKEYKLN